MSASAFPAALDDFPTAATIAALQQSDLLPVFGKHSGLLEALGSALEALEKRTFGIWINVVEHGADPTGVADSTTAIHNARDALPAGGGGLEFPHGTYKTTGLSFKDRVCFLRGAAGRGQLQSSGDRTVAPVRIKSTTNAPIVTFTETSKTSIESQFSGMENIAICGSTSAGSAQNGLVVDNRGFTCSNVEVAGCGNDGIVLADCVTGRFDNVFAHQNTRYGWMLDPTLGTGTGPPAVTNTTFISCAATGNGSHGIRMRGTVWGCLWLGGDTEGNTGFGIFMSLSSGSNAPRFNRFYGIWDELNGAGSVRFDDSASTDNVVDYSRYSSGIASHAVVYDRNEVSGTNLALLGIDQRRLTQIVALQSTGGLDSSDVDTLTVRNVNDSDDGNVRAAVFVSTFAQTMAATDVFSDGKVALSDAFYAPNGRGLSTRNNANGGNYSLITGGANDRVQLAGNGNVVESYGPLDLNSAGATGWVRFPNVTSTQRDALGTNAGVGSVIMNTTTTKLQVKTVAGAPGTWVDLH